MASASAPSTLNLKPSLQQATLHPSLPRWCSYRPLQSFLLCPSFVAQGVGLLCHKLPLAILTSFPAPPPCDSVVEGGLRICMANKLPDDADAVGTGEQLT